MITQTDLHAAMARAALAPTVHNTQPARWRSDEAGLTLACDLAATLPSGDPLGRDAGLSCGAVAEAMVLALAARGQGVQVTDLWAQGDRASIPGHRIAARLDLTGPVATDPLAAMLERRFTWRGRFDPAPAALFGWGRADAVLVTDPGGKGWLAALGDDAGLAVMRDPALRHELLHWMRLSPRHPRHAHDGLSRAAMGFGALEALSARLALGPLWPLLDRLRLTRPLTAEATATTSSAVIACFHRPADESPLSSGRAYLRLCLEAAHLGLAGWPLAALSDTAATNAAVCARYGIGPDRRLIQVIRFGKPTGPMPPRARRPAAELLC
ncbi:MAG: hypothetical protein GW886_05125 [Rhodobacterales bacterium]|nr:hypothetical protein [Rhodobacterales bacterium]NCT12428.1 hypothetical protein [Rhodobacterales bacterium]